MAVPIYMEPSKCKESHHLDVSHLPPLTKQYVKEFIYSHQQQLDYHQMLAFMAWRTKYLQKTAHQKQQSKQ